MPKESVHDQIRVCLLDLVGTQWGARKAFASALKKDESHISQYFSGRIKTMPLEDLDVAARYFRITLPELLARALEGAELEPIDAQAAEVLKLWPKVPQGQRDVIVQLARSVVPPEPPIVPATPPAEAPDGPRPKHGTHTGETPRPKRRRRKP